MYVRDAKNREEVWLLDRLDELELSDPAFRSRDYVIAIDETTGDKAGFGRIRIHPGDTEVCELAAVGVLPEWRNQGVGAHVIERLVAHAGDAEFETVYAVTEAVDYLRQFGFEPVATADLPSVMGERLELVRDDEPDAIAMALSTDDFVVPERLREAFKRAGRREPDDEVAAADDEETAKLRDEFGIDPDQATYKYDTGS